MGVFPLNLELFLPSSPEDDENAFLFSIDNKAICRYKVKIKDIMKIVNNISNIHVFIIKIIDQFLEVIILKILMIINLIYL